MVAIVLGAVLLVLSAVLWALTSVVGWATALAAIAYQSLRLLLAGCAVIVVMSTAAKIVGIRAAEGRR